MGRHTIVIHRLLEPRVTFLEHLGVDICDIYSGFSVGVFLPTIVQYPQGDVTSASSNVQAFDWTLGTRLQDGNKIILPQPVHAH